MPAQLMVHCGGTVVPRHELATVATPTPTNTWHPIPHASLLTEVEQALSANGLEIVSEQHALAHDGNRYFGLLEISPGQSPESYAWMLGLRNSHDQTFPAGLVVGSRVFVCDNLAFSGEIVLARRHTRWIMRDLSRLVLDGVGQLTQRWHSQEARYACYRETALTNPMAHDLVVRALDAQAITTRQLPNVLQEWRTPTHQTFAPRTAWSLFNAVTHVVRAGSLWTVSKRTQVLHGVFDLACGLAVKGVPDAIVRDPDGLAAA